MSRIYASIKKSILCNYSVHSKAEIHNVKISCHEMRLNQYSFFIIKTFLEMLMVLDIANTIALASLVACHMAVLHRKIDKF